MLPPVMKTNANCKKLRTSCSKLKEKCSKNLREAIGNTNNGNKCKKVLKDNAKENVNTFCKSTCGKCGKY